MSEDREITGELAIHILDECIEQCRNILQTLEAGTENFDNLNMEIRSYQIHKEILLKGGDAK